MFKRISLLVRKPGISREEFARHWREIHGPLALPLPKVVRYVQNHIREEGARHPHLPAAGGQVDGIVEFWFENRQDMEQAFATPEAAALFADGALFIESVTSYVVEEHVVIGEASPHAPGA
jgi:uncharacterized protein (TIGR02118 family)